MVNAELFFKCENLQKMGAFKYRGAVNAVLLLPEQEAVKGVCTHSSGNHAQAIALAAQKRGIRAFIVMPENAPAVKVAAVKGYGGEVVFCQPTLTAREKALNEVVKKTGAAFIHPYNDARVIAGQGTAAIELMEAVGDLDMIVCPVGGGGLLSGTAISAGNGPRVIGAEPKEADDAYRSFTSGVLQPAPTTQTIADGLRTALGDLTFKIIRQYVHDIATVSEENILIAMKRIWERMKLVVEPSGAVPFGAILENRSRFEGNRIGIIISGGNVDLDHLPWVSNPAPVGNDRIP